MSITVGKKTYERSTRSNNQRRGQVSGSLKDTKPKASSEEKLCEEKFHIPGAAGAPRQYYNQLEGIGRHGKALAE